VAKMKKRIVKTESMQYRHYIILLITICSMYIVSCSKGGAVTDDGSGGNHVPTPSDTTAPVIQISAPVADQVFSNGNTISIAGRVSDDLGLYRGSISVTNDANGVIMKQQLYEIHGLVVYNFNLTYTAAVSIASDYTVTVFFEDHGYNSISKTVKIKLNP